MRIFEFEQPNKDGDPYDRGQADAWYGRSRSPHKYVSTIGSDGKKRVKLTDPEEIKAYDSGYDDHIKKHGSGGEKDYR